jgi:hypothetical protein
LKEQNNKRISGVIGILSDLIGRFLSYEMPSNRVSQKSEQPSKCLIGMRGDCAILPILIGDECDQQGGKVFADSIAEALSDGLTRE